ncbi:hypothetical protein AC579_7253 [Pseudocercospora musae]|uniref:Uncharacterized protein n=1 Tax=Pseudocercospora musae TaxID=113226 RepID=A0A139IF54_9PEZI|nr:hypothetical protein AC579_7253 [Pseudocercospora musae]
MLLKIHKIIISLPLRTTISKCSLIVRSRDLIRSFHKLQSKTFGSVPADVAMDLYTLAFDHIKATNIGTEPST